MKPLQNNLFIFSCFNSLNFYSKTKTLDIDFEANNRDTHQADSNWNNITNDKITPKTLSSIPIKTPYKLFLNFKTNNFSKFIIVFFESIKIQSLNNNAVYYNYRSNNTCLLFNSCNH